MPHQCTTCGQTFADGSKEMLSGCPECGGNTFQYLPSDVLDEAHGSSGATATGRAADDPPGRATDDQGVTDAVGRAATTVRDYVARRRDDDPGPDPDSTADASSAPTPDATSDASTDSSTDATSDSRTDAEAMPREADEEDAAQASARGEMVDHSDLPDRSDSDAGGPPTEGRVVKEPDADDVDRPALEDLRQELNEQFESIRIVAPGQYELNLMELYDREEHIIALQEDGRYVIQVPDAWRDE